MTPSTQDARATGLVELAVRCKQASGADRELDHDIYMRADAANGSFDTRYTASLDAAMTLVPEGLRVMLSEWDDEKHLRPKGAWQAVLSKPGCDASFNAMRGFRCDHAATPALALTAAALRAIASEKPNA